MRIKNLRFVLSFFLVIMLISMFVACKKTDDENTKASGNVTQSAAAITQSATATKTAASTTAKATIEATVQAGTSSKVSDSSPEISELQQEEDTEFTSDVFDEDTFYSVKGNIEEKILEAPIDLGGRTIIFTSYNKTNMIVDDPTAYAADNVIAYRRLEEAQKKYNFKVEYVLFEPSNFSAFNTALVSNTMAGIKMTDIFFAISSQAFPTYVSQNIIIPLDDYIDYENPIIKVNPMISEGSYFLGKHYGTGIKYYLIGKLMAYNRTLISKEGLPDILDLVEAKQWNWETLLNVAIACTKDIDGDGINDQYGLCAGSSKTLVYGILNSNGETGADFSTGKAMFSLDNTRSIKALQFVSDLVNVYKVYGQGGETTYRKGIAAMVIYTGASNNVASIQAGIDSIMIPLPMGPDVDNYTNIGPTQFHVVSSLCEDPADVVKVWTEACIIWDENLEPIPELLKLQSEIYPYDWKWSSANPSRYCTEEREYMLSIKQLFPLVKHDFTLGYPKWYDDNYVLNNITNHLSQGTKSVAQIIESVKYELQDTFDEYNDLLQN